MSLEIFQKFYDSTSLIIDQLSVLKANHLIKSEEGYANDGISNDETIEKQRACLGAIKKICEDVHAQREECIIHFDTICAEALLSPVNKGIYLSYYLSRVV